LVEEFDIPFEMKRELAEFINSVERLYHAVDALREMLAKCSAHIKHHADKIDHSVVSACRMSISDRYLLVKIILAEISAYNIDKIIEKILEQLAKPP
jgi:phosphoenolpyruvate-protein kinase (PTS system EI component)